MEVKELKEGIAGLAEGAVLVKKIMKDGKINFDDVEHVKGADHSAILEGIKGIEAASAEIKDLSLEEAKEVIEALMTAFQKVKAA